MISIPMFQFSLVALVAGLFLSAAQPAFFAKNVKVTPIGSHDGEFCRFDRAMILEDPDGTRTDTFIKATRVPVYIPLSGRTMEFEPGGRCVAGC